MVEAIAVVYVCISLGFAVSMIVDCLPCETPLRLIVLALCWGFMWPLVALYALISALTR